MNRSIWWLELNEGKKGKQYRDRLKHARFYASRQWRKVRWVCITNQPLCSCGMPTVDVHHIIPLSERFELALDLDNLVGYCKTCHRLAEVEAKRDVTKKINYEDFE